MKRGGSRLNANFLKKMKTEEVVICVLLVILVVLVVYYIYQNNSSEGFEGKGDKHKLYFFYTDWCGYSQRAQPVITDLQKVVDDYNTEVVKVDCEQEKALAKKFEIRAYPTIVFVSTDDVRKDYNDSVELEKSKKWLSSVAE